MYLEPPADEFIVPLFHLLVLSLKNHLVNFGLYDKA